MNWFKKYWRHITATAAVAVTAVAVNVSKPKPVPVPTPPPVVVPIPVPAPTPPPVTEDPAVVSAPGELGPAVTVTAPWDGNLSTGVEAIKAMPFRMSTRIVIDEGSSVSPDKYLPIFKAYAGVSTVMAEIADSFYMKKFTQEQYLQRTKDYYAKLKPYVSVWEIGNEINGSWLGDNAAGKMAAAFDYLKSVGAKTALTIYLDCPKDCVEPQWWVFTWVDKNVPERVRNGVDYVLVSYYQDDQQNWLPNAKEPVYKTWNDVFKDVRKRFPTATMGIGEWGTKKNIDKTPYINACYRDMKVDDPKFRKMCFWWYFDAIKNLPGDMAPKSNKYWQSLVDAMKAAS